MIELKITLEGIDYDSLLPAVIPAVIKNPIAAKAALAAARAKLKNMTSAERDAFIAEFLSGNRNRIRSALNSRISAKGITGEITDFKAVGH